MRVLNTSATHICAKLERSLTQLISLEKPVKRLHSVLAESDDTPAAVEPDVPSDGQVVDPIKQRQNRRSIYAQMRAEIVMLKAIINNPDLDMARIESIISSFSAQPDDVAFNQAQTFYTQAFLNSLNDDEFAKQLVLALYQYFASKGFKQAQWAEYVNAHSIAPIIEDLGS